MIIKLNSYIDEFRHAPLIPAVAVNNSVWLKRVDDGAGGSAVGPATIGSNVIGIAHVVPRAVTTRVVIEELTTVDSGGTPESSPTQLASTNPLNILVENLTTAT